MSYSFGDEELAHVVCHTVLVMRNWHMWCVKPRVLIGKLVLACANMLCSTAEHAILAHSSAGFDRLVC